jgi:hypothetical protein
MGLPIFYEAHDLLKWKNVDFLFCKKMTLLPYIIFASFKN